MGKDVVTIVVGGSGATKSEAINDALTNAVRQTNQSLVTSQTDMSDDRVVSDLTSTYTKGKVLKYSEVGNAPGENGSINVILRVDIQTDKLKKIFSSKAGTAQVAGSDFIMRKKASDLQKANELELAKKLIDDMYELWNLLYDYKVKAGNPSYINDNIITIDYIVDADENANMKAYRKLMKDAFKVIDMKKEEREDYERFYGHAPYYWNEEKIYMRNEDAIELLRYYVPMLKEASRNCYYIYDNIGGSRKAQQSGKFPHIYTLHFTQDEFAQNPVIRTAVDPNMEIMLPANIPPMWIPEKLKKKWQQRRDETAAALTSICRDEDERWRVCSETYLSKGFYLGKDPTTGGGTVNFSTDGASVELAPKTITIKSASKFDDILKWSEIFSTSKIWANRFNCKEGPHNGTEYTFVVRMGNGRDYRMKGKYWCEHKTDPSIIHVVKIVYDLESLQEQFGSWDELYKQLSTYGIISIEDGYDASYPVGIGTKRIISAFYYEYNAILHPDQAQNMLYYKKPEVHIKKTSMDDQPELLNIRNYTTKGIVKVASNRENLNRKVKYLAYKQKSCLKKMYNVVVKSPSGKKYTLDSRDLTSHKDIGEYCISNGNYYFIDLQAIEPGTWTLRLVQKNAGSWYYKY